MPNPTGDTTVQYNVTYENHPFPQIYGRVPEALMVAVLSKKKGFKAFTFLHKPTRIAMVTIIDGKPHIGDYHA